MIKNGLVHEISKINLPKQLMDDCNCIDEVTRNQSSSSDIASTNANLINKEILFTSNKPDYHSNTINHRTNNYLDTNQSSFKSTIIPESLKRRYLTLHNRQYRPIESDRYNQTSRSNESMFRPMVFYDKSDLSYYTTSSNPKIPVSYHNNHNYYNPNNKTNKSNNNFFVTDANSLAFPANSLPSYSALPNGLKNNQTLETPFLTIFDPFTPFANQSFSNPRSQFHSTVNLSQSSPSMTHYLTHVYHGDNSQLFTNSQLSAAAPFVYNMERLGIPNIENSPQSTTYKPFLNTKPILYQVVPTVSPLSTIDYPTKNKQSSKIVSSSKYYNDLTTPTPMYFDPTRKPKSPSYLNRIRRVNDLANQNQFNLQTSYQVMDSNVVQKIEDTKTSSNNNQQVVVPARLDINQLNHLTNEQYGRNRFNMKNNQFISHRNRPMVTLSTVSSNNFSNNSNQSTRNGRILKNRNGSSIGNGNSNNTPYITLLDVLRNPYLMINNEPVEFTQFENLLNQTNLANLLRNRAQLTLVLPTDLAFRRLKDYELDYLKLKQSTAAASDASLYSSAMRRKRQLYIPRQEEMRLQVVKNLVLNHLSPILVNPDSIVNQVTVKSYSNYNLQFVRRSNKLYLNNMPIIATTIVSNGVAYVVDDLVMNNNTLFDIPNQLNSKKKTISPIDTILNPTLTTLDTSKLNSSLSVVEIIENIPDLSFFTGLVKKSNYSNQLASSDGAYTVLAPENKSFSYLSHNVIDLLKNSQSFINRFVGNHIINANFSINNLIVSPIVLNLNKMPIKIENSNGMILLNDTSMMKKTNIATSTGFIHILTHSLMLADEPYSSSNVMLLNRSKCDHSILQNYMFYTKTFYR